jgi:hypothetical protein
VIISSLNHISSLKKRCRWVVLCAAIGFVACASGLGCSGEEPTSVARGEASGRLEFAVGGEVRTFELADATCEPAERGSARYLNVIVPAAFATKVNGRLKQPALLTAQLPIDLLHADRPGAETRFGREQRVFGGAAAAFNIEYDGKTYKMLQIIARTARDATDFQCRVSRKGEQIVLSCNDALVFPWLIAGDVPNGSFRATFRCADAS